MTSGRELVRHHRNVYITYEYWAMHCVFSLACHVQCKIKFTKQSWLGILNLIMFMCVRLRGPWWAFIFERSSKSFVSSSGSAQRQLYGHRKHSMGISQRQRIAYLQLCFGLDPIMKIPLPVYMEQKTKNKQSCGGLLWSIEVLMKSFWLQFILPYQTMVAFFPCWNISCFYPPP